MTAHALTVDLEDWHQLFHRQLTGEVIRPTRAVVSATHHVLDMLDEARIRATFFVLGNVADTYPELVREVVGRGHEIGSHGYSHELIFRLQPATFKADVERSLVKLQTLPANLYWGFVPPSSRSATCGIGVSKSWSSLDSAMTRACSPCRAFATASRKRPVILSRSQPQAAQYMSTP
jgi:peptidoglycan/xylan/chitin deacetylase (PgdA/CDA1 family)